MRRLLKHWPLALALTLALICAVCVWRLWAVSRLLDSQKAAGRWQGGGSREFAQLTCCLPPDVRFTLDDVHKFRNDMAQKLKGAGYDVEKETGLYNDAWSAFTNTRVANGRRSGEVQVVAVGGGFFDFHPLRLISGNYLTPNDVMDDRVLLDKETAWMLFGASDVAGMSFSLNGIPVVAAGVYEHERDGFSRLAYGEDMRVYMSYSAFQRYIRDQKDSTKTADATYTTGFNSNDAEKTIGCYEILMAEPVKGFAYSSVTDKFPVKTAHIVENTYRFEPERLFKLLRSGAERSMLRGTYYIPYWENAARAAEDRACALFTAALLTGALPLGLLLYWVIRSAVHGKRKLESDVLPNAKEKSREFFREQSRKRWEKKHPGEY